MQKVREVEMRIEDLENPQQRIRQLRASNPRNERLEEIRAERAKLEKSPTQRHDEAVAHFDYSYKDVMANPVLGHQVLAERQRVIEEAARENKVIDWNSAYPEIGEKVRKAAGLPTSQEREHFGWLEEARLARKGGSQ